MPPRVPTEPGTALKQTTISQIIPADSSTEREKLNLWEYMLGLKSEEYGRHMAYVYRWLDNGEVAIAGKLSLPFDEFTLKDNFGGGSFRIILKNGSQICKRIEKLIIEGKSKIPDDAPAPSSNFGGHNGDPLGLIARILDNQSQLFERMLAQNNNRPAVDEAYRGALALQSEALRSGVTTVRELNPSASAAPNPMDEITRQFMQAAITKMMNPADPIEAFAKMATALKQVMPDQPGNTSWGVEAIRAIGGALPQIAQAWAASQLPQRPAAPQGRTIDVQPQPLRANADDTRNNVTPMPAPANGNAAALPPAPATETSAALPPAPPPQGGEIMAPNIEWIEARVVDLINHPELTPEQAASEVLSFLQTAAPVMIPQLSNEGTLRYLFNTRTILRHVPDNPRREEVFKSFLALVNGAPAPATPASDEPLFAPDPPPAA